MGPPSKRGCCFGLLRTQFWSRLSFWLRSLMSRFTRSSRCILLRLTLRSLIIYPRSKLSVRTCKSKWPSRDSMKRKGHYRTIRSSWEECGTVSSGLSCRSKERMAQASWSVTFTRRTSIWMTLATSKRQPPSDQPKMSKEPSLHRPCWLTMLRWTRTTRDFWRSSSHTW